MTNRGMVRAVCAAPTLSPALGLVRDDASGSSDIAPPSRTRVRAHQLCDLLAVRQEEVLVRARAKAVGPETLELALECATPVDTAEFLILSHWLNEARASAVAEYEEQRRQDVLRRDEQQLNQLAGELAKFLDTAFLALGGLKGGSPELHGPAEALLDRSLRLLRERIDQALCGVRAQTGHC